MILTTKTKILMIIAAVLFATTIGTGIYYISTASSAAVKVTDFTAMTKEEVLTWAKANHVSDDQITFTYAFDEEAEEDTVISQSIEKDTALVRKQSIEITLSSGPDPDLEMKLIDFKGMKMNAIREWFEKNKFSNVQFTFTADEEAAADEFLKCDPACGTSVRRSDPITVTICSGTSKDSEEAKEVTVPDFKTYTRTNIQAWGATNKITIRFSSQSSDTVRKDAVISQSPSAGSKVKQGGTVSIVLSSGKGLTVTSFIGKPRTAAEQWVNENGLKAQITEVFSDAEGNTVISQTPSSGSISAGSTVSFQISGGLVPLSDYTGKSRSEFETYIANLNTQKNKSAKITVSVSEQESDSAVGTILSQSASGNVKPGTSVTIKVAVGKKVAVADKRGTSEESFRSYLSSLGLRPGNISYAYDDSVSSGSIIRNDTGSFAAGSSISYTVSKGSYRFSYDGLINAGNAWSALDAKASEARSNGWSVTASYAESEVYDSGIITENCSVSGKSIACKVSSGKVAAVPNVVGMSYDAGIAALKNAGFNATASETSGYRDEPAGQIIGQSIAANTRAKAGSTVALTYSKGPKPIETAKLPNISIGIYDGKPESEIRSLLTNTFNNAGFYNLNFVVKDTSKADNENGVESISPYPDGSVIDRNTTITIVILSGKTS